MKQKQSIKLTESQLRNIIKESIKNVLNEKIELPWQGFTGHRSEFTDDESYELYKDLFGVATKYNMKHGSSLSTDEVIGKITGGRFKTVNELLKAIQINDAWKEYVDDLMLKYNDDEWSGAHPSIYYDYRDRLQYKPSIENINVKDDSDPWNDRPPHANEPGRRWNIGNVLQWQEHDKQEKQQQRRDDANMKRALAAADKRPLNRKGSLNRGGK